MKTNPRAGHWNGIIARLKSLTIVVLMAFSLVSSVRAGSLVSTSRLPAKAFYPQTATDSRGRVHLIYFVGDPLHGDIFYARSDNDGKKFSTALRVNSQPGSVIVIGTVRGPQLAIGKDDRVHVAWMGSDKAEPKVNETFAPMLYTRVNSAGDGFEPQKNVISIHPGLDGGGSIAADSEGNVYVAWHAPDGDNGEADRRVWITRSADDGKTFQRETAAIEEKTGACGCCGMRIAAAPGGRVYILYRSANQKIHRDMELLQSADYGKTFAVAATDPWQIGACVMSTAALVLSEGHLLAAWETEQQIYVLSTATDQPVGSPLPVSSRTQSQKHPAIAVNAKGDYIVAWTEGTGWNRGGSVAWQVFSKAGRPIAGQSGSKAGLPPWSLPAVFAATDNSFRIIF